MGKSSKRYKKESFSQKMREVTEIEDLDRNGYMDMISNNKRIKSQTKNKYYEQYKFYELSGYYSRISQWDVITSGHC